MSALKNKPIERKIINVSSKRKVTIPLKFYEKLRIGKEIEMALVNDAIMIRPHLSNDERSSDDGFSMEILKDLVSQGYGGDELIAKFSEQRTNINRAINILIEEADEIVSGKRKGTTTKELFGEE